MKKWIKKIEEGQSPNAVNPQHTTISEHKTRKGMLNWIRKYYPQGGRFLIEYCGRNVFDITRTEIINL